MSLSDAVGGESKDAPAAMISVKVDKLDTAHAAAMVMKAIKGADVNALEDALELFVAACNDKYEGDEPKDEGDAYDGDTSDEE